LLPEALTPALLIQNRALIADAVQDALTKAEVDEFSVIALFEHLQSGTEPPAAQVSGGLSHHPSKTSRAPAIKTHAIIAREAVIQLMRGPFQFRSRLGGLAIASRRQLGSACKY
jgi:hypothetical protein